MLGDAGWTELLGEHHRRAREELDRCEGVEIDTAGDGFLATFDGPARAVRAPEPSLSGCKTSGWRSALASTSGRSSTSATTSAGSPCIRRAGRLACRSLRGLGLLDRKGPYRRLRPDIRRRRRARAQGRSRPLAPLPGGERTGVRVAHPHASHGVSLDTRPGARRGRRGNGAPVTSVDSTTTAPGRRRKSDEESFVRSLLDRDSECREPQRQNSVSCSARALPWS